VTVGRSRPYPPPMRRIHAPSGRRCGSTSRARSRAARDRFLPVLLLGLTGCSDLSAVKFPLTAGAALAREPALIEETCRSFQAMSDTKREAKTSAAPPAGSASPAPAGSNAPGNPSPASPPPAPPLGEGATKLPPYLGPLTQRRLEVEYGHQLSTLFKSLNLERCPDGAEAILKAALHGNDKLSAQEKTELSDCQSALAKLTKGGAEWWLNAPKLLQQLHAQLQRDGASLMNLIEDPLRWAVRLDLAPAFLHLVTELARTLDRYIQQTGNSIPYVGPLFTAVLEQAAAEVAAFTYELILDELLANEYIGVGSAARSACALRTPTNGLVTDRILKRTILRLRAEQWSNERALPTVRSARSLLRFTEGLRFQNDYPLRVACQELREAGAPCEEQIAEVAGRWTLSKSPKALPPLALPPPPPPGGETAVRDRQAEVITQAAENCPNCTFIDSITLAGTMITYGGPEIGQIVFGSPEFLGIRKRIDDIGADGKRTRELVEKVVECQDAKAAAIKALASVFDEQTQLCSGTDRLVRLDAKTPLSNPDLAGKVYVLISEYEFCERGRLVGSVGMPGLKTGKEKLGREQEASLAALLDAFDALGKNQARDVWITVRGSVDEQMSGAFPLAEQKKLASKRRRSALKYLEDAQTEGRYKHVKVDGKEPSRDSVEIDSAGLFACERFQSSERAVCLEHHRGVKIELNLGKVFQCALK
jgi:hypothetical protein